MSENYKNAQASYKEHLTEIHQLAFTELYTPKLQESVDFFTKILGMTIVAEEGETIYLRAYEDLYLYSLALTASENSGLGVASFRTKSPDALERLVKNLENSDQKGEWVEPTLGRGPAYRFQDLDGHHLQIFWEVEPFQAHPDEKSKLLNRRQRRPIIGVPVRRIDHINMFTHPSRVQENAYFYRDVLGFNIREGVKGPDNKYFATWMSVSPLVHEVALMADEMEEHGRLHHLAFWYGFPQHLDDLAELCVEYGIPIEAGPLKHGVSQAKCMYIIEPGGNRIELFGDSGYLIFEPDWQPVDWAGESLENAIIWYGGQLPATFFRHGTPAVLDPNEELNIYQVENMKANISDDLLRYRLKQEN